MRDLVLITAIIGIALLANSLGFPPFPIIITGVIFLIWGPNVAGNIKYRKFDERCDRWLKDKGYNYKHIGTSYHAFTKGRLRGKASSAQLIFSINNGPKEEFWFSCGSWWLGPYVNEINVYQAQDDKVEFLERINA